MEYSVLTITKKKTSKGAVVRHEIILNYVRALIDMLKALLPYAVLIVPLVRGDLPQPPSTLPTAEERVERIDTDRQP